MKPHFTVKLMFMIGIFPSTFRSRISLWKPPELTRTASHVQVRQVITASINMQNLILHQIRPGFIVHTSGLGVQIPRQGNGERKWRAGWKLCQVGKELRLREVDELRLFSWKKTNPRNGLPKWSLACLSLSFHFHREETISNGFVSGKVICNSTVAQDTNLSGSESIVCQLVSVKVWTHLKYWYKVKFTLTLMLQLLDWLVIQNAV